MADIFPHMADLRAPEVKLSESTLYSKNPSLKRRYRLALFEPRTIARDLERWFWRIDKLPYTSTDR